MFLTFLFNAGKVSGYRISQKVKIMFTKRFTFTLGLLFFFSMNIYSSESHPSQRRMKIQSQIVEGVNENACKYYLSLCAIFQNEARYLKEWIEFHRIVGVQHFYLYNNNSSDHFLDILSPYIKAGIVDLIDWPSPPDQNWIPFQEKAYNHCIRKSSGMTRWLAVIDIDEFIIPVDRANLQAFLIEYDSQMDVGGIMAFWQFYGTSWCKKLSSKKLMVEQLVLKAPEDHPWNHQVKSICKPHKVAHYCVHGAHYKEGYHDITTNGNGGPHQPVQINRVRVNHYWTRDEDFYFKTKVPRRERYENRKYTLDEIRSYVEQFNQIEDRAIFRFIPELRKRIFRTKH